MTSQLCFTWHYTFISTWTLFISYIYNSSNMERLFSAWRPIFLKKESMMKTYFVLTANIVKKRGKKINNKVISLTPKGRSMQAPHDISLTSNSLMVFHLWSDYNLASKIDDLYFFCGLLLDCFLLSHIAQNRRETYFKSCRIPVSPPVKSTCDFLWQTWIWWYSTIHQTFKNLG